MTNFTKFLCKISIPVTLQCMIGMLFVGLIMSSRYKETIIYAELDMNLPAACKMEHDAIGHYARPDVLELKVNEK